MGDRLRAWSHRGKESREEALGMSTGAWRQKDDKGTNHSLDELGTGC